MIPLISIAAIALVWLSWHVNTVASATTSRS
jgi:hypothetical protein